MLGYQKEDFRQKNLSSQLCTLLNYDTDNAGFQDPVLYPYVAVPVPACWKYSVHTRVHISVPNCILYTCSTHGIGFSLGEG